MNDDIRPKVTPTVSLLEDIGHSRKKKAFKRLGIIVLGVAVIGGGYWYFAKTLSLQLKEVASFGSSIEGSIAGTITSNISTPPPLRAPAKKTATAPKAGSAALTREGVIADTNKERVTAGLPQLAENATLDSIATLRLDDMFEKQYFAHVAPDGSSATSTAKVVGYDYLALGENLALGNFAGDADIVAAWMASPGHRENILGEHYDQIGVAVRKGTFEGASTWIGVQVFGKPSSDCASPDATLKANIATAQGNLNVMQNELDSQRAAIDAMNPKEGPEYNAKVQQYNDLVAQYNSLANDTKTAVAQYNAEVTAFNACLGL